LISKRDARIAWSEGDEKTARLAAYYQRKSLVAERTRSLKMWTEHDLSSKGPRKALCESLHRRGAY